MSVEQRNPYNDIKCFAVDRIGGSPEVEWEFLHSTPHNRTNRTNDDAEFDAALEKRRNDRKKKKTERHSKLDRLVDVAARLECLEEELGKATADKAPNETLLTCAEWEVLKQRSAEKGQNACEQAQREFEECKIRRDAQEQARLDALAKKNARNNVARNLDGIGDGGFFASLGGDDIANVPKGTPSAVLEYLSYANKAQAAHSFIESDNDGETDGLA